MSATSYLKLLVGLILDYQLEETVNRIKSPPTSTSPQPAPSKPKPPVPIEQQPSGPVMQPKPKEPAYPTEEQIIAFAKTDPDLQSLVSRYSQILNNRHVSPLDSTFNT